jgi:protocatechuate 3,4-dioxygenase beta subunit
MKAFNSKGMKIIGMVLIMVGFSMAEQITITGKVVDYRGYDVPDVEVWAVRKSVFSINGELICKIGVTDENGNYQGIVNKEEVIDTSTRDVYFFAIPPSSSNLAIDGVKNYTYKSCPSRVCFELMPKAIIQGRITDSSGNPVPNCLIEPTLAQPLLKKEIKSDINGFYEFDFFDPHYPRNFRVIPEENTNFLPFSPPRTLRTPPGRTTIYHIKLRTGGMLQGRVIDQAGQGVSDVVIRLHSKNSRYQDMVAETISDNKGNYIIRKISGDRLHQYVLRCQAIPGYKIENTGGILTINEGTVVTRDIEVLNLSLTKISGKITDKQGNPISDVKVEIWRGHVSKSNAEGEFVLEKVPPGECILRIRPGVKSKFAPQNIQVEVKLGETIYCPIILLEAGKIIGQVVDTNGQGIKNVVIEVWREVDSCFPKYLTTYTTDIEGKYIARVPEILDGAPEGRKLKYFFNFYPPLHLDLEEKRLEVNYVSPEQERVLTTVLVPAESSTLTGRVTREHDGFGVKAELVLRNSRYSSECYNSDSNGRYIFRGLKEGIYTLKVNPPGKLCPTTIKDIEIKKGEVKEINIRLKYGNRFKVVVKDKNGRNITKGLRVVLRVNPRYSLGLKKVGKNRDWWTHDMVVPPGDYFIDVWVDKNEDNLDIFSKTKVKATIPPERYFSSVKVEVELPSAHRIIGKVVDIKGKPVKDVKVSVERKWVKFSTYTDSAGNYICNISNGTEFRGVHFFPPSDDYRYKFVEMLIKPQPGGETSLDNVVLPNSPRIIGQVKDEEGNGLKDISVFAWWVKKISPWSHGSREGFSKEVKTDEKGNYVIKGLYRGIYKVRAKFPAGVCLKENIKVEDKDNFVVRVDFDASELDIEEDKSILVSQFSSSYPNPFNPECYIPINVKSKKQNVKCKIYNILGQLVREIKISDLRFQISKSIYWDGKDSRGLEVPAGVYFYEVAGQGVRKMIVLR